MYKHVVIFSTIIIIFILLKTYYFFRIENNDGINIHLIPESITLLKN